MAFENEARFHLDESRLTAIVEALKGDGGAISPFKLSFKGEKDHADTYFDINGALLGRGWSLRLRQSGNNIRATLKRPAQKSGYEFGDLREEIENQENQTLPETAAIIVRELVAGNVIHPVEFEVGSNLLLNGLKTTFASVGLNELFTVRTTRHRWIVSLEDLNLAELVVDDSSYDVGSTSQSDSIRECRIEVELLDAAKNVELNKICAQLASRFHLRQVHESKFERGMLHVSTRGLREKLELKILVTTAADYDAIVNRINNDPKFLSQYRFSPLKERAISDVYFDTEELQLFEAGQYLRLRQEGQAKELVFRWLTQDVQYGEVLQEELVARGDGETFQSNWDPIRRRLSDTIGRELNLQASNIADTHRALLAEGFRSTLDVEIQRQPWIVHRIDIAIPSDVSINHVAKLKYDRVKMRRPDRPEVSLDCREFEATGVDSDDNVPFTTSILAYDGFVAQFMEACAHTASDSNVTRQINAKYFHGVEQLGIAKRVPVFLTDGRLAFRVSLLRAIAKDDGQPSTDLALLEEQQQALDVTRDSVTSLKEIINDQAPGSNSAEGQRLNEFIASIEERIGKIEDAIARVTPNINLTVVQNSSHSSVAYDMGALVRDLSELISRAQQDGQSVGTEQVAALTAARDAAAEGSDEVAISYVRKAAGYIANVTKDVAVPVLIGLLKKHYGIK